MLVTVGSTNSFMFKENTIKINIKTNIKFQQRWFGCSTNIKIQVHGVIIQKTSSLHQPFRIHITLNDHEATSHHPATLNDDNVGYWLPWVKPMFNTAPSSSRTKIILNQLFTNLNWSIVVDDSWLTVNYDHPFKKTPTLNNDHWVKPMNHPFKKTRRN